MNYRFYARTNNLCGEKYTIYRRYSDDGGPNGEVLYQTSKGWKRGHITEKDILNFKNKYRLLTNEEVSKLLASSQRGS